MQINIKMKPKWYSFDKHTKLLIGVPTTKELMMMMSLSQSDIEKYTDLLKKLFITHVKDWEGMFDNNNKEIKCNNKNKKSVFDVEYPITGFFVTSILDRQKEMTDNIIKLVDVKKKLEEGEEEK